MTMQQGAASIGQGCGWNRFSAALRKAVQDFGDGLTFFGRWLRNPAHIASVAPSGRALAALITREIDGTMGAVLELGSGTGAFVPALLRRGIGEHALTLVERDPALARLLARRYPRAAVLNLDAANVARLAGDASFGAVVCGLGLRNMRQHEIEAILRASLAVMKPGAAFYLFTYGPRCSVPADSLDRLGLDARRIGATWRNLPPAAVYRISRRPRPTVIDMTMGSDGS